MTGAVCWRDRWFVPVGAPESPESESRACLQTQQMRQTAAECASSRFDLSIRTEEFWLRLPSLRLMWLCVSWLHLSSPAPSDGSWCPSVFFLSEGLNNERDDACVTFSNKKHPPLLPGTKILTDHVDVISRFAAVCLFVAAETHSLSVSLLPRCALTINRMFRSFPLFILRLGVQVATVTIGRRA